MEGKQNVHPDEIQAYRRFDVAHVVVAGLWALETWTDIAAIRHAATFEGLRIEPKETELYVHDVCIPPNVRYVQIYTWIMCEAPTEPIGDSLGDDRPRGKIQIPESDETWYALTWVDLNQLADKAAAAAAVQPAVPSPNAMIQAP
jgi:hypothetical protein